MLVLSLVMGPPEGPCFDLSLRVRSGLIIFPTLAFVGRFKEHLRSSVQSVRIVRRKDQWKVPLETIFDVGGTRTHRVVRVRIHVAQLAGTMIVAGRQSVVRSGKDYFGVFRRRRNPTGLAATNVIPVTGR